jgi:hypothetical protein
MTQQTVHRRRETIVYCCTYSPDGEYIICGTSLGELAIWPVRSSLCVHSVSILTSRSDTQQSLHLRFDSKRIAVPSTHSLSQIDFFSLALTTALRCGTGTALSPLKATYLRFPNAFRLRVQVAFVFFFISTFCRTARRFARHPRDELDSHESQSYKQRIPGNREQRALRDES